MAWPRLSFLGLLNLIKDRQFDTIYHEHFSYFWLHVAMDILAQHHLKVFAVEKLPNLGGSLRLFVTHAGDHRQPDESVDEILNEELEFGVHRVQYL